MDIDSLIEGTIAELDGTGYCVLDGLDHELAKEDFHKILRAAFAEVRRAAIREAVAIGWRYDAEVARALEALLPPAAEEKWIICLDHGGHTEARCPKCAIGASPCAEEKR